MGLDGVGWGTAVTLDKVWTTSFNGKICVMDFNGHPIGKESDFPFTEKLTGLMGIGVAANGDVWIADGSAQIDTDADGVISEAEQPAYAERVLRDLSLTIGGNRCGSGSCRRNLQEPRR